jgi:hypothetical protein
MTLPPWPDVLVAQLTTFGLKIRYMRSGTTG